MKSIAIAAATLAVTAGVLGAAAPAQADDAPATPSGAGTTVIHHRFGLHYLTRAPHMAPRGMTHSVRQAHRPH